MVLVDRARRLIGELARAQILDGSAVEDAVARAPRFQNIAYPLALPPLLVDTAALPVIRDLAERYVGVLEKLVRLYRRDKDVRAFFGLDGSADELVDAEGDVDRSIAVCRLDGYVDAEGALHVLENNADCPAGTLFTSRLNRLIRALIAPVLESAPVLAMDDGDPFTEMLAGRGGSQIVVLQVRGKANIESQEVAAALSLRGIPSAVADPRDLELTCDGLIHEGQAVGLVWNKINMSAWLDLVREAPCVVATLAAAARHENGPVMFNSFGARHVAETKTSLALLHDRQFRSRFDAAERELIERLVPWTVRLDRESVAELDGREWPVPDLAAARQQDLVLKQRYDIRGDGVTVGRAVTPAEWNAAVAGAWNSGAVLQRYIAPVRYPVVRAGDERTSDLNISLDSFVFDGRLVGLGAKASAGAKVNLFQGGSKLAVMAVPQA